ncbi:MAG: Maf family protein [Defluviitaleaceae bacterium]|nr:Maf family protein [Defluviitaleaceae bacterium]
MRQVGFDFEVIVSDVDEDIGERDPAEMVRKLAYAKAESVAREAADAIVIGADTTVWIDGEILGKPSDAAHAFNMLKQLSGRMHTVYTGLAVFNTVTNEREVTVDTTDVYFRELSDTEIKTYVATGEPMGKAGSYGIQGRAAMFVERVEGDFFTIVGLPLYRLSRFMIY